MLCLYSVIIFFLLFFFQFYEIYSLISIFSKRNSSVIGKLFLLFFVTFNRRRIYGNICICFIWYSTIVPLLLVYTVTELYFHFFFFFGKKIAFQF